MDACRILIESTPGRGSWNMAVDEALLESAVERGTCALRLYRWSQATVSLGYFQDAAPISVGRISNPSVSAPDGWEIRPTDPDLTNLPTVRRLSGGGAILHHHEWTYSCVVPAGHPLAAAPRELYARIHEGVVALLSRHGIAARRRGRPAPEKDGTFLCFARGDANDVLLEGHKILGSAQRRRRGAVLQHGSLLLRRSQYAPQFPGLRDLAPADASLDFADEELAASLATELGPVLARDLVSCDLDAAEHRRAVVLEAEQYRRLDWRTARPVGSRTDF